MEICPEIPSLYPFFPKKRKAAAMCSFIHLRSSCALAKVGKPGSLRVPLRFPRATAWNFSSSAAAAGVILSGVFRMDRSGGWFVVRVSLVIVEVDIFRFRLFVLLMVCNENVISYRMILEWVSPAHVCAPYHAGALYIISWVLS